MEWLLLVILVVVVLVLGVLALVFNVASGTWRVARSIARRGRDKEPGMRLPAPRCLRCRGTGWLNRDPERTFTFTGDGFEDRHTPATMCQDCGGTGLARQR
ncbi:hypothetical protein AB0M36_06465 [Actinoplanes sp. NPDC051346]|uniref:hypothetical protein n=1 Tax=Actinoplanes sp. NPDC051346 TaxID=3155048 RepID=UPI003414A908